MNTVSKKIKTLIVDDEAPVRALLSNELHKTQSVELVGEASNVPEAVKLINSYKPELVFLDIEMPGYSGLQLLDFFNEEAINFTIIFVTAYHEYAIKAFKLSAFDYLLKPVDYKQLQETIERYRSSIQKKSLKEQVQLLKTNYETPNRFSKIAVSSIQGIDFIEIVHINYLEAENNYTIIHLTNQKTIIASKAISEFESILKSTGNFFRIHRSYMINLQHILRFSTKEGALIEMKTGKQLPLSRYRKKAFETIFNNTKI